MTFDRSHLLVSDAEQNSLTSALACTDQADPIAIVIAEKVARAEAVTAGYDVPEGWLRGLVRALVLYDLYSRLGPGKVPENIREAHADAQQDLTDIRDGKYRNLAVPGETPARAPNDPAVQERHLKFTTRLQEGL